MCVTWMYLDQTEVPYENVSASYIVGSHASTSELAVPLGCAVKDNFDWFRLQLQFQNMAASQTSHGPKDDTSLTK